MSKKSKKVIFWIATGLLTLILLATIGNSIFNSGFSQRFAKLGYPTYLIVPLMIAKTLGIFFIWTNTKILKEWAYAGFFFLFMLALLAEIHASDTDYISPILALALLAISYVFGQKKYLL